MDIRLKELPFSICGCDLTLRCNMNVLADLQEAGHLDKMLDGSMALRSFNRLLAAMVNEAADAEGVDLCVTDRDIGREVSWTEFQRIRGDVFGLLVAAVAVPEDEAEEEQPKNGATSEAAATA